MRRLRDDVKLVGGKKEEKYRRGGLQRGTNRQEGERAEGKLREAGFEIRNLLRNRLRRRVGEGVAGVMEGGGDSSLVARGGWIGARASE